MGNVYAIMMNNLLQRLRAEWRLKLAVTIFLNLWVGIPYYGLQHVHFFPETAMPAGIVDHSIPFVPNTVWLYLSLYLLMPIAPLLMQRREELMRYTVGMAGATLLATIVFIFWPTICLRPALPNPSGAYQLLVAIDRPFHAFPSLHACFAVYSVLCARVAGFTLWLRLVLWTWTALIDYGALATKQHVFIDLIAGGILGALAFYAAFRWQRITSIFPAVQNFTKPSTQEHS
jgi:membrane-associated phospholipid phosphatase